MFQCLTIIFALIQVGNKVDLEDRRAVSKAEGLAIAKRDDIPFFESSAKLRINIDEVNIFLLFKKIAVNLRV